MGAAETALLVVDFLNFLAGLSRWQAALACSGAATELRTESLYCVAANTTFQSHATQIPYTTTTVYGLYDLHMIEMQSASQ